MVKRSGRTWTETSAEKLLGLSADEMILVEFRAGLALALQKARKRKGLTQGEAAEQVGSSQARLSKMEAGQSSITIDRMIRALVALGVSRLAIIRALGTAG